MPCFLVHGWWVKDKNLPCCLWTPYILVDWFMVECLVFASSSLMWIVNDKPLSGMIVPLRTQLLISMTSMCGFYWLLWKVCGFIFCHLSLDEWLVFAPSNERVPLWLDCLKLWFIYMFLISWTCVHLWIFFINSALWIDIVEWCRHEIMQTFLTNALGILNKEEQ